MTVYILPQCGCKISAAIVPKYSRSFGDGGPYEKRIWFEHICEMHLENMKCEYLNDERVRLENIN